MIGTLVGLLFLCIIAGFIWWAAQQLLAQIAIAEPFATFIRIIIAAIVLVIVLYALAMLLGMAGVHVPSFGGFNLK